MAPRGILNPATLDLFGIGRGDADATVYIDDRYRVLRPLGEGAFATVLLCSDERRRGRLVAIKGVRTLSPDMQRSLMHEFVNARRLRHPNLVSVLDTGVCRRHGLYIVLEYVDGPDLVSILDREDTLEVDVAAEVCRQIARALAHMHRSGLLHRDVKPDNVFMEGARAKLGDFGASRTASGPSHATMIFTPGYAPPETTLGKMGPSTDAYSLGALFHLAVAGTLPPTRTTRARQASVSARMRSNGGGRAAQLAARLLAPNPARRLSDMRVVAQRFGKLVKPGTRRRLRSLVEAANVERQRVDIEQRWSEFEDRFGAALRPFGLKWDCVECRGPVSEAMLFCPWCGDLLRFRSDASFPRYCGRCEHGLHNEWCHCPWCQEHYPQQQTSRARRTRDHRYDEKCDSCRGPMMRYMSCCPWCGETYTWHTRGMNDTCSDCGYSVLGELFGHCPWCGEVLSGEYAEQVRERVRAAQRDRRRRARR